MFRNGRALPLLDDETRAVKSARFSTQRWITKAMLLENAAPLVQRRASIYSEISFARERLECRRKSSFRLSIKEYGPGPSQQVDYHTEVLYFSHFYEASNNDYCVQCFAAVNVVVFDFL